MRFVSAKARISLPFLLLQSLSQTLSIGMDKMEFDQKWLYEALATNSVQNLYICICQFLERNQPVIPEVTESHLMPDLPHRMFPVKNHCIHPSLLFFPQNFGIII